MTEPPSSFPETSVRTRSRRGLRCALETPGAPLPTVGLGRLRGRHPDHRLAGFRAGGANYAVADRAVVGFDRLERVAMGGRVAGVLRHPAIRLRADPGRVVGPVRPAADPAAVPGGRRRQLPPAGLGAVPGVAAPGPLHRRRDRGERLGCHRLHCRHHPAAPARQPFRLGRRQFQPRLRHRARARRSVGHACGLHACRSWSRPAWRSAM